MKKFAWLILLLATPMFSQYGRFQNCQIQTAMGQAVQGASVYFLAQPANTATLTPLATVYSNSSGASSTNPVYTNGFGMCTAYLANGTYTVCYVSPYMGTNCYPDQAVEYGVATGMTVGVTPVNSGTTGYILYDNGGTLGDLATTGTGNVVLATSPTISALTVTSSFTATGLVTNSDLVNTSTSVNGNTCTLGGTCTVTAVANDIIVGTTSVNSGTNGYLLSINSGKLGNVGTTGTGTWCWLRRHQFPDLL